MAYTKGKTSSGISYDAFKKQIKSGDVPGLILIDGDEPFLKQALINELEKKVVGDSMPDFNLHRFDGERCSVEDVLFAVETLPFMSERTLIILRNFNADNCDDDGYEQLASLLKDPPEHSVIVFFYENANKQEKDASDDGEEKKSSAVKRMPAFKKLLNAHAVSVSCDKLTNYSAIDVIKRGVKSRGGSISNEDARFMLDYVGNDLNMLQNETDKLCVFTKGREITRNDIRSVCVRTLEASVFDIAENIFKHDAQQAMSILVDLFAQKEEPIKVLGALSATFIDIYRLLSAYSFGADAYNVAEAFSCYSSGKKKMNTPQGDNEKKDFKLPYRLKKAENNAHKLSLDKLKEAIDILSEADLDIKSSMVDGDIILEKTVLRLLLLQS